jgi:ribosomal-protein-serine acetyltransferase
MTLLELGDGARLRSLGADDTPAMFAALELGRAEFDRWLRWTPSLQTAEDVRAFLSGFAAREARGDGFHLGIFQDGELAGGVICWEIHARDRTADVGYWLATARQGRGLATRATAAAVEHLFGALDVHRVEFWCAEANLRSRALAERLGFTLESVRRGTLKDGGGTFRDHVVWARLERDPAPAGDPRRGLLTGAEFRGLLDRLAAAWQTRDYAAAGACFAKDVRYADPTRYAHAGRAALRAFFENDEGREQRVAWHEVVFDAARQVGAVEYTYEGSHRYHGTVLVRVDRGVFTHWREYQHVDERAWEEFAGETRFP